MFAHIRCLAILGISTSLVRGQTINLSKLNAPYAQPTTCTSLKCTLIFDQVKYNGPTQTFVTRGYDGGIPGPTIRVRAGDNLQVTVVNNLENTDNINYGINEERSPNSTNLHLHGLHVSPAVGQDNVSLTIPPKSSMLYNYTLPPDLNGGTHWYHPHNHGSAAIQGGGGASGFLIVEDLPGDLPDVIAKMTEQLFMLTSVDSSLIFNQQKRFQTYSPNQSGGMLNMNGTAPPDLLLANGMTGPVVDMVAGQWYRWRICYASLLTTAEFTLSDGSCEMQLLAKDGAYLPTLPRLVQHLPLYPGARADVAVRCDGSVSTVTLDANTFGFPSVTLLQVFTGVVVLNIVNDGSVPAADLPSVTLNRPCWQANTLSATPDEKALIDLTTGGSMINNVYYGDVPYLYEFAAGKLIELDIVGQRVHPFHLHQYHYQLVTLDNYDDPYFQQGDWHDTILIPSAAAVVRFYTVRFTGMVIIHCHFLTHEDFGMMNYFNVTGAEGTEYPNVRLLEPKCYNDLTGRGYE